MSTTELDRIRERYKRRLGTYDAWVPWIYMTRQELERALIKILTSQRLLPPSGKRLLDIGCGAGAHLQFFMRLGFSSEDLVGIELQHERVEAARSRLPPTVSLMSGDASQIDLPDESFDVVFQSLVFSSILDDQLQAAVAEKMWRLTRPGGGVLWYDFTWNNPRNQDVRGVSISRVKELFPHARPIVRRVTLAPPLARFVTQAVPAMYTLFNCVPLLRTHVLCWLPKLR
jgi:ubiquinone/menaquinone biosynthesis C-methylase UbiE